MIWAIRDPLRYAREVAALAALTSSEPALSLGDMRLGDGGQLVQDFDVEVCGRRFAGVLAYPQSFPEVPPTVRPRGEELWSFHQYGPGGELCLEWGPDNWLPEVTGADLVSSAIRLISVEGGDPLAPVGEVATRHATTVGQDVRHSDLRLVCTAALETALASLGGSADATFSVRYGKPGWRAFVTGLAPDDGPGEWADASIPLPVVDAGAHVQGRVLVGLDWLPRLAGTASELRARLLGRPGDPSVPDEIVLCVAADGGMAAAYLFHARDAVLPMAVVRAGASGGRLDPGHDGLGGRRVAVVGCGSLGSKVAVSLARSGVRRFLLVDDDVLLPGNLVRNELDWTDVGLHKVDALEARIRRLVPDAEVAVRRHRLGGQESNGSLDGAVAAIAACDLIVDATADPRAFNYAAAAAGGKVPMVWGEVFGGGFGGLVARSRPGLDPSPHLARARIEGWCRDRDRPAPRAGAGYGALVDDVPMIADDAAVALIAGALGGMTVDILAARDPSRFPHSAYMVGMAREWIFEGPFDTWPIDLGAPGPGLADADHASPAAVAALRHLTAVAIRARS